MKMDIFVVVSMCSSSILFTFCISFIRPGKFQNDEYEDSLHALIYSFTITAAVRS